MTPEAIQILFLSPSVPISLYALFLYFATIEALPQSCQLPVYTQLQVYSPFLHPKWKKDYLSSGGGGTLTLFGDMSAP